MEDGQSIDQDHGERTRSRKRKSSRAKSGLRVEALTFHCCSPHTPKGELAKRIREAEDANKSVLEMHAVHHHDGRADVNFSGSYTNFLDRQITGRVNNMENLKGPAIMNRRNEMVGIRVERTQYRRWGDGQ